MTLIGSLFVFFVSQSTLRSEEGAHKAPHERVYGLGPSSPSGHVKTISTSTELGAQQVARQAVEVSMH